MSHRSVLVVDDEARLRSTLTEFLQERGYQVSSAPDSRSAVELTSILSPDIILLDFDLPRVNGLDALPALQFAAPEARIIVITGCAIPDLKDRVLRRGAFDFVCKPLEYAALADTLEAALAFE